MDSFSDFLNACQSLASSAGEFASLAVLAVLSYLLVVVRSLKAKLTANLTRSVSGFAPGRRKRAPRASPSSSALPGASAASLGNLSPQEANDGLSQIPPVVSPVERFVQSLEEPPLPFAEPSLGRRPGADGPNPVGGAAAAQRDPDGRGPDAAGSAGASGGVLGVKSD